MDVPGGRPLPADLARPRRRIAQEPPVSRPVARPRRAAGRRPDEALRRSRPRMRDPRARRFRFPPRRRPHVRAKPALLLFVRLIGIDDHFVNDSSSQHDPRLIRQLDLLRLLLAIHHRLLFRRRLGLRLWRLRLRIARRRCRPPLLLRRHFLRHLRLHRLLHMPHLPPQPPPKPFARFPVRHKTPAGHSPHSFDIGNSAVTVRPLASYTSMNRSTSFTVRWLCPNVNISFFARPSSHPSTD